MKARYREVRALPRLAWLARVRAGEDTVEVSHGQAVESKERFFVEGVWNAPFESGNFDTTECFFGSGAVLYPDAVVFVAAADTVDGLFYGERDGHYWIANSLPLLLGALDDRLDEGYDRYHECLDSVLRGIFDYEPRIATRKGEVRRLFCRNLRIDPSGAVLEEKPSSPRFASYDDYVAYLESAYAAIAQNARSLSRARPLQIFSTQSRGYDTTAVNAIAAKHGIDKVFTCTLSRDKNAFVDAERAGQLSDDGTLIGKSLGFECVPMDRVSFRRHFPDEELHYAGHHDCSDVNLREIHDHVGEAAVLLTGVRGEVWYGREFYKNKPGRGDSLMKFDMAGHGLSEVRLHSGLIHLPFPFLGARRQDDIHAITEAGDMAPWRLGTAYDRPVPRRIAEERGVPRELFGQVKLNTTVAFPKPAVPFDARLRREFLDHLVRTRRLARWQVALLPVVHRVNEMIHYRSPTRFRALYYLERALTKLLGRPYELPLLKENLRGALYCFCVNRLAARNAAALSAAQFAMPTARQQSASESDVVIARVEPV